MNTNEKPSAPCGEREIPRRVFLERICFAVGAGISALIGLPVVGYLLAPFFEKVTQVWRDVGAVAQFQPGQTVKVSYVDPSPLPWAGVTANTAAWLRCEPGEKFTAFSINCTHLGCPIRWEQKSELFLCPCHGGVYYKDGTVAAGPPPQPLTQYPVRVQNGRVQIKTQPLPIA
jgi:menaquinol-cytochrome c reductase iron-sulfur subunit